MAARMTCRSVGRSVGTMEKIISKNSRKKNVRKNNQFRWEKHTKNNIYKIVPLNTLQQKYI